MELNIKKAQPVHLATAFQADVSGVIVEDSFLAILLSSSDKPAVVSLMCPLVSVSTFYFLPYEVGILSSRFFGEITVCVNNVCF